MKIRNFVVSALAAAVALVSCKPQEENLGMPSIKIGESAVEFTSEGGEKQLTITATRDWMADWDADWLVVSPESGSASADAQTVTVTALSNTGMDRSADVKFTIGMASKTLKVTQAGPGGSAEALVVYSNDFDISKAQNNSGWPYLDSNYDLWDNKKGTGSESVTYAFGGKMSVRTSGKLSNDGSGFSHYAGSGMNKVFFGAATSIFKIQNITLDGAKTDYALSFGGQRYTQDDASNVFSFDEFKVYVSNDAEKWVPVAMAFPADADLDGDWNLASSKITLPSGTEKLSIAFVCTKSSAYSIDDVLLELASEAGQAIDFSKGEEIGGTTGGGGSVTPPSDIVDVTVAEFNAKPVSTTDWYRLTGTVSGPINTQYGNYDLSDDTGKVYVYGTSNWSEYSSDFAEGGTVTIVGQRGDYNGKIEVLESYIESYTPGEGGSDNPGNENEGKPASLVKATVAEFLAAAEDDTWYELTGEIISIAKEDYGNFTIKDATGEVYIYGMTNGWVGHNDKSFSKIGLKVGDTVTLGTLRGSYQGTPQGGGNPVPAYYISHVPGEGGGEVTPPAGGDDGEGAWSYTFANGDLGSSTVTLNGLSWNFVMNDADYLGFDSSNGRGLQMGKKADPASSITLSTEGIEGTVTKIVVNSAGASGTDAVISVKVGGNEFGSSQNLSTTPTDYVFEGQASGKIEIGWTVTAAAVYVKSITIYTE
ncbi:MAG: BACON domain-containing protein [Bacteroidales bacterium]|nr:BACON domain-containing protein [Bacteroidales bacterium]